MGNRKVVKRHEGEDMMRRNAVEGKLLEQRHKRMKRMQKRMKDQDPGACKIPWNPGDKEETNILQGCHIISQAAYLDHIAENHHVMHWWFDPKKIMEALERSGMMAIETLEPSEIPAEDCTTRYACNWHDHKVFAAIDTGNLDLGRAEHRFLLAFRAMAGSLSAWQAPIAYVEKAFPRRADLPDGFTTGAKFLLARAEDIFGDWQNAYLRGDYGRICAYHVRARCLLRCAGTSTVDIGSDNLGTLTLLPEVVDGELTGDYDIIVVALRKSWRNPMGRLLQIGTLKRTAVTLKMMLEASPGKALKWMATNMNHVAVNPADYENEDLIRPEERGRIEQGAASQVNSRLNEVLSARSVG